MRTPDHFVVTDTGLPFTKPGDVLRHNKKDVIVPTPIFKNKALASGGKIVDEFWCIEVPILVAMELECLQGVYK